MDYGTLLIIVIIIVVIVGGSLWNYFKRQRDIKHGKPTQFNENDDENRF